MSWLELDDYQLDAVNRMKKGCVLYGEVGSGKTRTALAWYYLQQGGKLGDKYVWMKKPKPLYVITTAKKRDDADWELEATLFLISKETQTFVVDSWNNIAKYRKVTGAYFIFDEQRVVGSGAWVKAFLDIARKNTWVLLSATPGDKWEDYIPLFVANGFYKNRTEFKYEHLIYKPFSKYPQVIGYQREGKLMKLRKEILINMDDVRTTVEHHEDVWCVYNRTEYLDIVRKRKDPETGEPIKNAAEYCYLLRKVLNSSRDRLLELHGIYMNYRRVVVFYNFDYELENIMKYLDDRNIIYAQWNGHKHEPIPNTDNWIYLVQYTAGAEGWNCTKTDTMVFFSQTYSYKTLKQAAGRINRKNTPYKDLYYYHFKSKAGIDRAIEAAIKNKRQFNEKGFYNG